MGSMPMFVHGHLRPNLRASLDQQLSGLHHRGLMAALVEAVEVLKQLVRR